jgi:hypothetical protein
MITWKPIDNEELKQRIENLIEEYINKENNSLIPHKPKLIYQLTQNKFLDAEKLSKSMNKNILKHHSNDKLHIYYVKWIDENFVINFINNIFAGMYKIL